ncbi:heme-thiolate peroxidase [Leucocoprinus birnbaumii]|uniref:Heme-thiolate peroxidase n=1 Tax=Leucocoprinus birnbaumii TaxID=56174 RepID=A0AAD5VH15_9AGAR|nr:heme-thiolate peroxidase [Leucocoprinus birnbaumii]
MVSLVPFVTLALASVSSAAAHPAYGSLAGLSREALAEIVPTLEYRRAAGPPPPITYNGTKLVNDAQHPYRRPGPNDMRGPCPGLNTLANHGYIPHSGIATPEQLIDSIWSISPPSL